MMRFTPSNRFSFTSRTEYDLDSEKVAYADLNMEHTVSHDFSWRVGYIGRDHRIWDYVPSAHHRWNYQYSNIISIGFKHDVCDWFAWGPFVRWDARCGELDETGAWFPPDLSILVLQALLVGNGYNTEISGYKDAAFFDKLREFVRDIGG